MSDRGMPLVDCPTTQRLVPHGIRSTTQVHPTSAAARTTHSSISSRTARRFRSFFRLRSRRSA